MKLLFVPGILMLIAITYSFQSFCQSAETNIDTIAGALFTPDGPGGIVLAARNGKVVYRKAFGMANLELNVTMQPEHIFRIGLLTKQFTACAIMKLAEAGKLSLQDTIAKYVPGFHTHGRVITIENLLTHTSGIREYTAMNGFDARFKRTDISPQIRCIDHL